MMAKEPMGKPEVIAPVKSKAKPAPAFSPTSPSTYVGGTKVNVPVDDLADYGQTLVQNYAGYGASNYGGLAGAGQAGGGGATVVPVEVKKPVVIPPVVVPPANTADAAELLRLRQEKAAMDAADLRDRQSAYDILFNEFSAYGLGGLVEDVKYLLQSDVSPSQFSIELKNTKSYKDRFAANENRIKAGLRALSPAEYIGLEDQYQEIMRNYGLPASYYTKDGTGKQVGFEKFIAGDVSAVELEDRIGTAQKRVINANPEVSAALKQFYPDITNGDILAYTLDPSKGLESIKRKVTAAEIGGAAMIPKNAAGQQILTTSEARAMQLAGYGVDKAQATQGYSVIGSGLQRGSELASIYGESPYTQATAEEEVFRLSGQTEAEKQRKKITGLEKAAFGGQTGLTTGALARDRAGGY
jgi:hypothetical protein